MLEAYLVNREYRLRETSTEQIDQMSAILMLSWIITMDPEVALSREQVLFSFIIPSQ